MHDPMFLADSDYGSGRARRVAPHRDRNREGRATAARARQLARYVDGFLDQIEAIDKQYPIRTCAGHSLTRINSSRRTSSACRRSACMSAVHPWAVINGGINRSIFGDGAYDMAPLATIQRSGITWGLAATAAARIRCCRLRRLVGRDRQDGRRRRCCGRRSAARTR